MKLSMQHKQWTPEALESAMGNPSIFSADNYRTKNERFLDIKGI